MAEETKQIPIVKEEVVVIAPVAESIAAPIVVEKAEAVHVAVAESIPAPVLVEKAEAVDVPEPEVAEKPSEEVVEPAVEEGDNKVAESASFKEESNVVADLPNPQQKALDELKELVKSALEKHEFTAPPPPAKEAEAEVPVDEKKEIEEAVVEAEPEEEKKEPESDAPVEVTVEAPVEEKTTPPPAETEKVIETKVEEKTVPAPVLPEKVIETKVEEKTTPPPALPEKVIETKVEEKTVLPPAEPEKVIETKKEEKTVPPPSASEVIVEKTEEKVEAVEEIKETIVEVPTLAPTSLAEEAKPDAETTEAVAETTEPAPETESTPPPPPPPEEVSIWGIKLLEDDKSDAILLKFLRARDFKVKEAFAMLKSVVQWRKEFGIDSLIEEETTTEGLEKVVYLHGVDKEGHCVLYNSFGEFQDKELYQNTFADAEKRTKFLRGIIQFFEKTIRSLDFTPDGICTLFQVIDLKNSPGLFFFKKDLRQAISHALQLFQDNYPEFVAKQVYINVPWWFRAYYSMINAIFSPRTKSKFVFAGPSKSAEILFKYVAPEEVPVRYGGLSKEGESEFKSADATTEVVLKPTAQTIEFEVTENCTLAWELRVIGWDVSYAAEFVPSAEGGYTVIVQKPRKVAPTDEPIISSSYTSGEAGKVVLTINNQTSKRKNLVYRSKSKHSE